MRGYSESVIFTCEEQELYDKATRLVESFDEKKFETIRCHELARAVGQRLGLPVQDGHYGFVDHSWLWTRPLGETMGRVGFPNILDVYSVGQLPMVRLVDGQHTSLPHVGWAYRPDKDRDDVRTDVVEQLVERMNGVRLYGEHRK